MFDQADLGSNAYGCDFEVHSAVFCSFPIFFYNLNWISKAPGPVPPVTNMISIFTPLVWLLIFCSIILFCIFLWLAARVGKCYGIITEAHYDFLVPFR